MEFVETSIFTRTVIGLLSDDEYRKLQASLFSSPDVGDLIPSTGGLRKLRWGLGGRGKRGGVRVIYYWAISKDIVLMLYIYAKNVQDDLTPNQRKQLARIVKEEYP